HLSHGRNRVVPGRWAENGPIAPEIGPSARGGAGLGREELDLRPLARRGEQGEGDEDRDRVAGQTEDEGVFAAAEEGGAAGPQRNAPEDLLDPELRERVLDVVVRAARDAAADDQDVGGEGRLERRHGRLEAVAGTAAA